MCNQATPDIIKVITDADTETCVRGFVPILFGYACVICRLQRGLCEVTEKWPVPSGVISVDYLAVRREAASSVINPTALIITVANESYCRPVANWHINHGF